MPGFFDVIFGSSPAEPAEPKPKKVKKVKSKAIEAHPLEATVQGLRDEVSNLRKMISPKIVKGSKTDVKGEENE